MHIEHAAFVSVLIHSQIDECDELARKTATNQDPDTDSLAHEGSTTASLSMVQSQCMKELRGKVFFDGHVLLHSQQTPVSLLSIGDNFHTCLANWLSAELEAIHVQLPCNIELSADDYVSH